SDQWGNIVTGTELIRRKAGGEAFALTCPLIKKADGTKFGKTEQGNIWLDENKTTPFQFYQFWLNATDADAPAWLRIFTFLDQPAVKALEAEHAKEPWHSIIQKKLAEEVTRMVHGEEKLQAALETTRQLFSQQNKPISEMTAEEHEGMEGIVKSSISIN